MSNRSKHDKLHGIASQFKWKCVYCGTSVHCQVCEPKKDPHRQATRDHYFPKSRGGKNDHNIVLACRFCNNEKGSQVHDVMPIAVYEAELNRLEGMSKRERRRQRLSHRIQWDGYRE